MKYNSRSRNYHKFEIAICVKDISKISEQLEMRCRISVITTGDKVFRIASTSVDCGLHS